MTEGYRNIDEAVSEDFVKSLKDITGEQVRSAMRLQASPAGAARVLNRIHNMQHRAKAKEITAGMLVSNGFERFAEISIPSLDVRGKLVDVLDINNDTTIALKVRVRHMESSFLVERGDTIVIWPVDYQQPNRELREAGMRPRITPIPRPLYASPGAPVVSASAIKRSPSEYLGRRIVADGGQIDGILREVEVHSTAPNSVIFKVDEESHQLTTSEGVKVYPKSGQDPIASHGYFTADYLAEHLTTFFGKTVSIMYKGTGRLEEMRVSAEYPNQYIFILNGVKHIVPEKTRVHVQAEPSRLTPGPYPWGSSSTPPRRPGQNPFLASPRTVTPASVAAQRQASARRRDVLNQQMVPDNRPDYQGDSWWMYNNRRYVGSTIQLGSGNPTKSGVKGVCSQITYEDGKLIFVIDGLMYKRNRHGTVKVWDKKEN